MQNAKQRAAEKWLASSIQRGLDQAREDAGAPLTTKQIKECIVAELRGCEPWLQQLVPAARVERALNITLAAFDAVENNTIRIMIEEDGDGGDEAG